MFILLIVFGLVELMNKYVRAYGSLINEGKNIFYWVHGILSGLSVFGNFKY